MTKLQNNHNVSYRTDYGKTKFDSLFDLWMELNKETCRKHELIWDNILYRWSKNIENT